ncbi:MAG: DUF115 domain-containing protein [Endomicrobiia bacterium]|nr:DUF115 domain-containing protein [Endomicrobiia bacterium]
MLLSKEEVHNQSMAAWNTWRQKWIKNCRINKRVPHEALSSLLNRGKEKILAQAAFGASLRSNIEHLKKYRDKFDLACCDKAFGFLMSHGITPDYCIIADASVSSEWQSGYDTSKTILVSNIAANPEWTVNWKGPIAFYVNWDNIDSAKVLAPIADCREVIAASSNVSNAQVVFASQILGYKYQLLLGYDYSWREDGDYYAGGDSPKRNYMHHLDIIAPEGYIALTSSNLYFSCFWLMQYLMRFPQVKAINCSDGLLGYLPRMAFDKALDFCEKKGGVSWQ